MPTTDDTFNDRESVQWEQAFRDARPALPESAMARIQTSLQREMDRAAVAVPPRPRRWPIFIVLLLVLPVIGVGSGFLLWSRVLHPRPAVAPNPAMAFQVSDSYPLELPIGPPLDVPQRPILALVENWKLVGGSRPAPAPASIPAEQPARSQQAAALLHAAERLAGEHPDGSHALGLLEMRRAAGLSPQIVVAVDPQTGPYRSAACWWTLPLSDADADRFRRLLDNFPKDLRSADDFWEVFRLCLAQHDGQAPPNNSLPLLGGMPSEFPSAAGARARQNLLVQLGVPPVQAGMEILTTRSYRPLEALASLDRWPPAQSLRDPLRARYFAASHDLIERVFALRLLGQDRAADELLDKASAVPYLNDPRDLAALISRLGPGESWERVIKPLLADEAAFVESPPKFDDAPQRIKPDAIVQAASKTVKEGVTTYSGPIQLSAGPWRIECGQLTVFRISGQSVLLQGSAGIRITGIIGILSAACDSMTFNTETGDLKLTGHVHIEGWEQPTQLKSATISRTGQLQDEQPDSPRS